MNPASDADFPEEEPPPYESIFGRLSNPVKTISSNPKRFICLCTCIVIILILLAGTFVHHQLKSDDIDDKLDELKNTHIQRIRQQIDWLLTRDKEKMQTIAELRQELHDMEKQMAVLKENVKNIAEREKVKLIQVETKSRYAAPQSSSSTITSSCLFVSSVSTLSGLFFISYLDF